METLAYRLKQALRGETRWQVSSKEIPALTGTATVSSTTGRATSTRRSHREWKRWARLVTGMVPSATPGLTSAIVDFLKKNNVILPLGAWLPVGRARVLLGLRCARSAPSLYGMWSNRRR